MKKRYQHIHPAIKYSLIASGVLLLIIASNLYLQLCQNNLSWSLAFKFAFSWHTEKFFLGALVLLIFWGFLASLIGSVGFASLFYVLGIGLIGIADYLKMQYRQEPIYPDDLKMITELGMIKDLVGTGLFAVLVLVMLLLFVLFVWGVWRSRKLSKKKQLFRCGSLAVTLLFLGYVHDFNNADNLLRKAYNRTALWIPYSQKMNYYNTGFMGGFLYNLKVTAMDEPAGYSEAAVKKIVEKYQQAAVKANQKTEDPATIIYVMSESFSDPARLTGLTIAGDPLADYFSVADHTYSGQMLSLGYGGGTANIEFEALTGFSMALFNPQLTTPYTMLVPKMTSMPSIVSLLQDQGYTATAIHPYNTSMYKRKDVYNVLGFDQFLDESTMSHTDKIENNPYISDSAAYAEVMDLLEENSDPQFIHLVTMQTHMPYSGKYSSISYDISGTDVTSSVENYVQDISYSASALQEFITKLNRLDRRVLVVFWGDHLPGIYSDALQAQNDTETLHETEFLMYDNKQQLKNQAQQDALISPFYYAADLMAQAGQKTTGFYQLLLTLQKELPAFESGMYQVDGKWQKSTASFSKAQKELYSDYQMIQYDIVSGKRYSEQENFFTK